MQPHAAASCDGGDRQCATRRHRVERIGHQIEDRHLELRDVGADTRKRRCPLDAECNARSREPRAREFTHVLDHVGHLHDLKARRWSRAIDEGAQHRDDLLDLRVHGVQPLPDVVTGSRIIAQHLDVARHQVEWCARLVRHALGPRQ